MMHSFVAKGFLILLKYPFFFFFFHIRLPDNIIYYFLIFLAFILRMCTDDILFVYLFFSLFFHYQHGLFFNTRFHSYIWLIGFNRLYKGLQLFFFLCKSLNTTHEYEVVYLFLQLCKLVASFTLFIPCV